MSLEIKSLLVFFLAVWVNVLPGQEATRSLPGTYRDGKASAGPVLQTRWGEGCLYNQNCPVDTAAHLTCLHSPAGSGAIAMAQIMKFYGFPDKGTGEHGYVHPVYGIQYANFGNTTYDWTNMPDSLITANTPLSTLIYHCAVAQDMNFGPSYSASSHALLDTAFIKYFGYPKTAHWKNRNDYSDAQWMEMLRNELDSGHPLVYAGYTMTGQVRFFICDGYQGDDQFHFNWGFGGAWNGYYSLDNLNPGLATFTINQSAIFGLTPSVPPPASLVMDFENVPDFSLEFGSWSVNDVDKQTTYGIEDHTFPHQNEKMAFICFNPAQVVPSMAGDEAIQPHGGQRFGACFSANPPANNDWFISPQVQLGTNGSFSFWIKSYNDLYGLDEYQVAISLTGNSPADFTVISGPNSLKTTTTWTKKVFNLSPYNNQKVYLAIRCVSNDRFLMMIDDLEIKPQASSTLTADFSASKTTVRVGDTIDFSDQSSGAPTGWKWNFTGGQPSVSTDQNPSGIRYTTPGTFAVSLKVTNGSTSDSVTKTDYIRVQGYPSSMSLDFESLTDFILDFSPWTTIDVRGGETYGITFVTFPHYMEPMAWICFNPSHTSPELLNMQAHSGQKLGCSFSTMESTGKNPNDKWLISPRMSLGDNPRIEFWVQTYNYNYGYEKYNVLVSVNGMNPSEFVAVNTTPESAPEVWTLRSYSLDAYAGRDVYVAIQCITNDGFIFMVDDISISSAVGTGDPVSAERLRVYPNPAVSKVRIDAGEVSGELFAVQLIDATGKVVAEIDAIPGERHFDINVSDFPEGLYLVRLKTDLGELFQKVSIIH